MHFGQTYPYSVAVIVYSLLIVLYVIGMVIVLCDKPLEKCH